MSNERRVYQHYHTKDSGSTPSIETLYDGEIAVNMSDEQLFIKNTNNNLSVFRDDKFYQNILSKKISSDNIKTVNGESLLGNGNITVATDANVMAVDDEDIVLDDVDSNTYVKYVTQTLTNEQKAQARTNIGALSENNIKTINGESILGEGDLTTDIVVSSMEELESLDVPIGTKARVFNYVQETVYDGLNLGRIFDGSESNPVPSDLLEHPEKYTFDIEVDTSVVFPYEENADYTVITIPTDSQIYVSIDTTYSYIRLIEISKGFKDLLYNRDGIWSTNTSYLRSLNFSKIASLSEEQFNTLFAIAHAFNGSITTPATTIANDYVKTNEGWVYADIAFRNDVFNLITALNYNIPTQTSQLENDSDFVVSSNLKTIMGKSVVGTGDITISGSDITSIPATNIIKKTDLQYIKNNVWEVYSSQIAASRANRFALLEDSEFMIETSTNAGSTWSEVAKTDDIRNIFSGQNNGRVSMESNSANQMRITITPSTYRYFMADWFYIWYSGPYLPATPTTVDIEYSTGSAPDTWLSYATNIPLEGQAGPNMIWYNKLLGSTTSNANVRFTIKNSATSNTLTHIIGIEAHGQKSYLSKNNSPALAQWDHLYTVDVNKSGIFPAKVSGTKIEIREGIIEDSALIYALPTSATGDEDDVIATRLTLKTINDQSLIGKGDIEMPYYGEEGYTQVKKGINDGSLFYALPTSADGCEDDILVTANTLKTINGQSLIGGGNITISGGSSSGNSAYSEVSHGTSDTTFTITPNTFHIWDEVSSLTITLGAETSGVANEYIFQFTSGSEPTTLSLPDDIKWTGGETPTIEANKIYQISILKGLGSVLEWDAVKLITFSVAGNLYEAVEGMTWEQWINSEYNINNYYISSNIVRVDSMNRVTLQGSYDGISPTAVIQKDYEYRTYFDD